MSVRQLSTRVHCSLLAALALCARDAVGQTDSASRDSVALLKTVVVEASALAPLDSVGFTARRRSGNGYFYLGADIERRKPRVISEFFRGMLGVRVATVGGRNSMQTTRGGRSCFNFFLDNVAWQPMLGTTIDDIVPVREVGALEVYGRATTPLEFSVADRSNCSTVVIWTRTRLRSWR